MSSRCPSITASTSPSVPPLPHPAPLRPRQPVPRGEDLDARPAARRLGIRLPLDRLFVVTERGRVLQRIGDVRHRIARPGEVEVEQTDRFRAVPDNVPWTEVAMADDLARTRTAAPERPRRAEGRRLEPDRRFVVPAKEPSERSKAAVGDDLGPAGRAGLSGDEAERL